MFRTNYGMRCRRRRKLIGFLEPCLLVLLLKQDAHGYQLLNDLPTLGIDVEAYDPSVIYRALRELEMDGWVTSYEGNESQGPQRRMYHLTADGKDYLEAWIKDLRYSKDELERIIRFYEEEQKKLREKEA